MNEHTIAINKENITISYPYPTSAKEEIDRKIHMKMYDYYIRANRGKESFISMDYFGKKYTFQDLNDKIDIYTKALKNYGIEPGDYVSVLLPNMPEIVIVKMALNRVGAVSNLIDPRYNPNSILELVNNSNSKIIICVSNKYKAGIKPILNKLSVKDVFTINPFESIHAHEIDTGEGCIKNFLYALVCVITKIKNTLFKIKNAFIKTRVNDINKLLKEGRFFSGELDSKYVPNAPATVLYTSGTTGGPLKGAVHTNEAYNALHAELEYAFPEEKAGMVVSAVIPMFLSYGSGVCMFNSLVAGFEMKMHPTFKPKDFVKIVECDRANIIIGVPKFFQMMADTDNDFEYVDHIIIGGDKILPSKMEEFKKRFPKARIAVGYGETELLGVVSVTLNNEDCLESSGVPLPGITVKILNHDSHEEVPIGTEGEAFITGFTKMLGYLNDPEETKNVTFYDEKTDMEYIATGDIMKMMHSGDLVFLDRIKRVMKRPDGHQVNADTIEKALSMVKGTKEICVVGLRYKNVLGVIPTAFIEVSESTNINEMVRAYEKMSVEKLSSFRDKALAYVFIDKMPYTSNGKIDATKLATKHLEEIPSAIIVDYSFIS